MRIDIIPDWLPSALKAEAQEIKNNSKYCDLIKTRLLFDPRMKGVWKLFERHNTSQETLMEFYDILPILYNEAIRTKWDPEHRKTVLSLRKKLRKTNVELNELIKQCSSAMSLNKEKRKEIFEAKNNFF